MASLIDELMEWPVADIRKVMKECGLSTVGFVEKREFVVSLHEYFCADVKARDTHVTRCAICCNARLSERFWPLACAHMCCEECLARHLAEEAGRMMQTLQKDIRCPFPDCSTSISAHTAKDFCRNCSDVWRKLGLREKLVAEAKYPVVECPKPECVGVAYQEQGRNSAMCFLCEHKWTLSGAASADESDSPNFSRGVRRCPKCNIPIEKSWGCNHMRCTHCGRHFQWDDADSANRDRAGESGASGSRSSAPGASGMPSGFNAGGMPFGFTFGTGDAGDFAQQMGQFGQRLGQMGQRIEQQVGASFNAEFQNRTSTTTHSRTSSSDAPCNQQ